MMPIPEDAGREQLEQVRIEGLETIRAAVAELTAATRRELRILSTDLQAPLYDQQPFLEAARRLVTSGRQPTIQVLTVDIATAVTYGHRLIELARRLASFIEIRRLDPADADIVETFLLADHLSFIRQPHAMNDRTAILAKRSPLEGRDLARRFEKLWERASPDPNLRRLWL